MNSYKELSLLSYKELQALAAKNKVPGNIKKQLLVRILHAIKCGNGAEVAKMLAEIKKNRKKKGTKKVKAVKEENKSLVPVDRDIKSVNNQCYALERPPRRENQQQQSATGYQNVYRELLTRSVPNPHGNSDLLDLRVEATMTNFTFANGSRTNHHHYQQQQSIDDHDVALAQHKFTLSTNIAVINRRHTETQAAASYESSTMEARLAYMNHQRQLHRQTIGQRAIEDSQDPLLRRMLQAPAGADLGRIATPHLSNGGELMPMNSQHSLSTETASERDEQEALQAIADVPCMANSSFNVDSLLRERANCNLPQTEEPLPLEAIPMRDPQENCHDWLVTSVTSTVSQPPDYDMMTFNSTALMPYQSTDSSNYMNVNPSGDSNIVDSTNQQYGYNGDQVYNGQNELMEAGDLLPDLQLRAPTYNQSSEISQPAPLALPYYSMPEIVQPAVPALPYYSTPNIAQSTVPALPYYSSTYQQDVYNASQDQSNNVDLSSRYNVPPATNYVELDNYNTNGTGYENGYYQEQQQQQTYGSNVVTNYSHHPEPEQHSTDVAIPLDQTQQRQRQRDPPSYGSLISSYWPRWTQTDQSATNSRSNGYSLENTLNLCKPNYVNYSKLSDTLSTYSNKAPVMTQRRGYNSSMMSPVANSSSASTEIGAPQRCNYNASNWLLYAGGSVETATTIAENKNYDPILPTSYGVGLPESIF